MKNFFRSIPGKTALFILLNLFVCALFLCCGCIILAMDFGLYDISGIDEISQEYCPIWLYQVLCTLFGLRFAIYPIAFVLGLFCIIVFIAMLWASGRKGENGEILPGFFTSIPFDLLLIIAAAAESIYWAAIWYKYDFQIYAIVGLIISVNLFMGLCMGFATRIKTRTLLKNLVLYKLCILTGKLVVFCWKYLKLFLKKLWSLIKRFRQWLAHALRRAASPLVSLFHDIPMVWRTCIILVLISLVELFVIVVFHRDPDCILIFWFVEKAILIPVILFCVVTLRKLQKTGEILASGDLNYRTETKGLYWDFKKHAENLNSISEGMSHAVEERLKSERMKTELITNVSHDLKTPLTSIINYASLISAEPCDNPQITEYSDVLVRQSEKLKRLIEDLVEASKAATGNLDVHPVPCDASVFITQASGEYEDKLKAADLTLITKIPEQEAFILADNRRMWRVFDNLMGNICKYSQPSTRVYLTLIVTAGKVFFVFKNTSRNQLDMDPEELMERFVRGDSSRSTEGNGLGLSIARSLVEIQGGTFSLSVDGDLFKVVLEFPTI